VTAACFKATSITDASIVAADLYSRGINPDDAVQVVPADVQGHVWFISQEHGPDFPSTYETLTLTAAAFARGNRWATIKARGGVPKSPKSPNGGALTPELSRLLSEYVRTLATARSIYTVGAARERAGSRAVRDAHVPLDAVEKELRRLLVETGVRPADVERNAADFMEAVALGRSVQQQRAEGPR
jgi:hypothetical protein